MYCEILPFLPVPLRAVKHLAYIAPRTIELHDDFLAEAGVRVLVRMENENHPTVKGNKWWKLKHNLAALDQSGKKTVLTFGGAYSNHIYSVAAAANELELKSVGVIRGEKVRNQVLDFASSMNMSLKFVTREQYRQKHEPAFLAALQQEFADPFIIPEGGTNESAVKGCTEWGRLLLAEHAFDVLFLPVGTGGTLAGLVCGLSGEKKVIGISVLKGGGFLHESVRELMMQTSGQAFANWSVHTSYHHGGYGRTTPELMSFIARMKLQHGLVLDHVYTGKMMFALWEEIMSGTIARGTTVLALHTGGTYDEM